MRASLYIEKFCSVVKTIQLRVALSFLYSYVIYSSLANLALRSLSPRFKRMITCSKLPRMHFQKKKQSTNDDQQIIGIELKEHLFTPHNLLLGMKIIGNSYQCYKCRKLHSKSHGLQSERPSNIIYFAH